MKKLFTLIILSISSFFFFNFNSVYAAEYNFDSEEFNLLNDDFKLVRNWSINFANENDMYYIIQFRDNNYRIYFLPKESIDIVSSSQGFSGTKYYSSNLFMYEYINNDFVLKSSSSKGYNLIVERLNAGTPIYFYRYLDTNSSDFIYKGTDTVNISLEDFTYTLNTNDRFLSLYEISILKNGEELPSNHKEELSFLTNFYTICIDRINFLANFIINNYILLSMFVLFILIFVINLIFRRLL